MAKCFSDLLAFINPDKSVVLVLQNDKAVQDTIQIKVADKLLNVSMEPDSFNTLLVQPD